MNPDLALSIGPYPNTALSAGQFALIVVIPVLLLAVWLISVFVAARQPQHHGAAETTSLRQEPGASEQEYEQPEHKAA